MTDDEYRIENQVKTRSLVMDTLSVTLSVTDEGVRDELR